MVERSDASTKSATSRVAIYEGPAERSGITLKDYAHKVPTGGHRGARIACDYNAAKRPPSTMSVVPLTNAASDDARKQMAAARSSGLPMAPVTFSAPLFTLGLFHNIGVSTAPGATQFTRILRAVSSMLKPRVNASIAPFDAA